MCHGLNFKVATLSVPSVLQDVPAKAVSNEVLKYPYGQCPMAGSAGLLHLWQEGAGNGAGAEGRRVFLLPALSVCVCVCVGIPVQNPPEQTGWPCLAPWARVSGPTQIVPVCAFPDLYWDSIFPTA